MNLATLGSGPVEPQAGRPGPVAAKLPVGRAKPIRHIARLTLAMTGLSSITGKHPVLDLLLRIAAIAIISIAILGLLPALANGAG